MKNYKTLLKSFNKTFSTNLNSSKANVELELLQSNTKKTLTLSIKSDEETFNFNIKSFDKISETKAGNRVFLFDEDEIINNYNIEYRKYNKKQENKKEMPTLTLKNLKKIFSALNSKKLKNANEVKNILYFCYLNNNYYIKEYKVVFDKNCKTTLTKVKLEECGISLCLNIITK